MLPREGFIKKWDFRKDEDYRLALSKDQVFSSREASLLVVDIYPGSSREPAREALKSATHLLDDVAGRCIERAPNGFVAAKPVTRAFEQATRPHLSSVEEGLGSVLGYFNSTEQAEQQLGIRRGNVSYEEWLIGGCHGRLRGHPADVAWELEALLHYPDQLECVSVLFGETREVLLFARWWDGLDDLLRLLDNVQAGQPK